MQYRTERLIVAFCVLLSFVLCMSACLKEEYVNTEDLYVPTFTDAPKPTDPAPEKRVHVNMRDEYIYENAYINTKGEISVNAGSKCLCIPVEAGQNWFVWYPFQASRYYNYIADAVGAVRFENNQNKLVSYVDLSEQPQFHLNDESNFSGPIVQVPEGAVYMYVNLKLGEAYDYSDSACIMLTDRQFTSTWLSIGDSIAEFNVTAHRNWLHLASAELSANYYNAAISGCGYLAKEGYQNLFTTLPNDQNVDLITIYGSFNDICFDYEIGNADDGYVAGENNTLAGAMNHFFDQIKIKYPNAKVAVISPAPWGGFTPEFDTETSSLAQAYVAMLEQISKNKGFAYYDLFRESGLKPWIEEENQQYFHEADGCHPNDSGHKQISEKLIPYLRTVLEE